MASNEQTERENQPDYTPPSGKRFGPFKVLQGKYIGADPDKNLTDARGNELKDMVGNPIPVEMVKDPGSPPFYATCDLLQYNYPGMGPKFALVGGGAEQHTFHRGTPNPTPPRAGQEQESDGLEELSINELQQVASDEEIDLSGARKKQDIITTIRNHRSNQQNVE